MQAGKLATYDDLLGLPEGQRVEIIGGALVTHPSPLPRHGRAQRVVGRFIGGAFVDDDGQGGPGGWWILPEVDVRLGMETDFVPGMETWIAELNAKAEFHHVLGSVHPQMAEYQASQYSVVSNAIAGIATGAANTAAIAILRT